MQHLQRPDGERVAYVKTEGAAPTVVFFGGFMSDMTGTKATALEAFCGARGQAFVRFDYLGHGASSGRFEDGTIGRWTEDALAVLDQVTSGPLVMVGSSMGGWIMLRAALARRRRVAGLVGIAAAPDFTRRMIETEFDEAQRAALARDGQVAVPSDYGDGPYIITQELIDDGNRCCVLDTPIGLDCPVRLLHGMNDPDVPWPLTLEIVEALVSKDVVVTLIKNGDHRLSEPDDIARLVATVAELLDGHGAS